MNRTRSLRSHQRITLGLLFVAGIVNFLDRASLSVANVTIRQEMHLSATQMGWLLSAFSLAYGVAQLPLMTILDRAGTRSILGTGLAVWSCAQMLTGLASNFLGFLSLRVLLGIGEAPFYPCGIRCLREWFSDKERGRATAVMSSSQSFGLAIAPPVLAFAIVHSSWRRMFLLLGGIGLIVSLLWLVLHRTRSATEFASGSAGISSRQGVYRSLLSQRTVWGMMLGFSGINYTNWLYTAWLPSYLQEQQHLSLAKTGWVAAIPYLAGAAGMLLSGWIVDGCHQRGVKLVLIHRINLAVGMIASAAFTLVVAHASSVPIAVAGVAGALFCIHYAGTSGWGYTQAVSPARFVAGLSALQTFSSFLIGSAAPILTGYLLDKTHSFGEALAVCSAVALLGAISYLTLGRETGMCLGD